MKHYRMPKKYSRPKKIPKNCQNCGIKTEDLYFYLDESNIAITYNSPYLCKQCYEKKYGGLR